MKTYLLFLITILSFHIGFTQQCETGSLNLGTLDSNWVYKNTDLKITCQLPMGWYVFDYPATEKKYLRVGSDYRKMSEVLFESGSGSGPLIDMAQVKQLPFSYPLTFLSIAKLQDTVAVVPATNEIQQNYTVSFRAYYADTTDADHFLKITYKKITGKDEDMPQIKDGKLGELEYRYFMLSFTNKTGAIEKKIFGVKNFGCVNLGVRITYMTDADLALISDIFKDLKVGK